MSSESTLTVCKRTKMKITFSSLVTLWHVSMVLLHKSNPGEWKCLKPQMGPRLITYAHTHIHTHTVVNEGGKHQQSPHTFCLLRTGICSCQQSERKGERNRRMTEDRKRIFTVTKRQDEHGQKREKEGRRREWKRSRDEWEVWRLCFLFAGTGRRAAFNSQLLHPDTGTTTDLLGHWTLMFHFTCLCTLHTYRPALEIMFIINCRNTTHPHTEERLSACYLTVYSKLLNACNTSLSFIVWHEIKDAQGGVEKRSLTVTSTTQ